MKKVLVVGAILATSCGRTPHDKDAKITPSSIINGKPVVAESLEASSIVGISRFNMPGNICTGTIISEDLILTAAHCVSIWIKAPSQVKLQRVLKARSYSFKSYQNGISDILIQAEGVELLPATTPREEWSHDLAIVKLAEKIPAGFRPVAVLDSTYEIPKNANMVLAGFGKTSIASISDKELIAYKTTKNFLEYRAGNQMFVIDQINGQDGVYYGDSGGPAYLESNNELILAGSTVGARDNQIFASFMNVAVFKTFLLRSAKVLNASLPIFKLP